MSLYNSARDLAQRSFGCLGFSLLAHVGVLTVLLFAPHGRVETPASAQGLTMVEMASASTETPKGLAREAAHEATHEVLLANENDASAVALPPPSAKAHHAAPKPAHVAPAPKALVQQESDAVVKDEEFQPSAVADTEEKNQDIPEELSPVISEEPAAPQSSDSIAEETGEKPAPVAAPVVTAAPVAAPVAVTQPVAQPAAAPSTSAPFAPPSSGAKTAGPASPPARQANGMIVTPGSAVNGTPTGKSGYGAGSGQIVDASLRKPISGPLPHYSQQDRVLRREGMAVVVARVHSDGSVDGVYVERSSGSRDMDQAAVESFKAWKFVPGPEASVRKAFQFSLRGEAQVGYAKLKQ